MSVTSSDPWKHEAGGRDKLQAAQKVVESKGGQVLDGDLQPCLARGKSRL